jgi:hypothetical protein
MTGEVIQFASHRDVKKGHQYRQQPIPRGPAPGARTAGIVEFRVARITRLLTELEELTRLSMNVPPITLDQARAGLEQARRFVGPWAAARSDLGGSPQPELDDERIERMYRDLNQDA